MPKPTIVALAGGVGAARFLEGLVRVWPQNRLTVIGNVGDDIEIHGLHISPDLDIVAYTLGGMVDDQKGWGFRDDTFHTQHMLAQYGCQTWFNLGDRDLATHIYRTEQLRKGKRLSQVTRELTAQLGLKTKLLPATDNQLRTYIVSGHRRMHFQEYMVLRRTEPNVSRVLFLGVRSAKPAPGIVQALRNASGVIICPSNPVVSIGAILAVPRIRATLRKIHGKIVAISPIVGGKTIKGPADKLMKAVGVEATALGVANLYSDLLDTLVIDEIDRSLAPQIQELGVKVLVTDTIMKNLNDKMRLARVVLRELGS